MRATLARCGALALAVLLSGCGSGRVPVVEIAPGNTVAFGEVGVACGVPPGDLGPVTDRFPREGTAVWRLHDTDPEATGPRTQYITGFADGCPRQVTGALVLFGAPALHEVHRYSEAMSDMPWSLADRRYEAIRAPVFGVPRRVLCPEDRLAVLRRDLAFVSVYPAFGLETRLELLLHDGQLATAEQL